jgi:hypothetical protein
MGQTRRMGMSAPKPEREIHNTIRQRNMADARNNLERWENTNCGYQRWWLERHTMKRIRELAAFDHHPATSIVPLLEKEHRRLL